MHRIRMSTRAFWAVGLATAMAAGTSVANAQPQGGATPPTEDKTRPTPPEATVPEKSMETRPGPLDVVIQFSSGKVELEATANGALDQTAAWLKEDPTRTMAIEVHPDEVARGDLAVGMSDQRAVAIKAYLVAQGVGDSQIAIVATGQASTAPVGRNHRTVFIATLADATAAAEPPLETTVGPPLATAEPQPALPPSEPITLEDDDDPSDDHLLTPFGMAVSVGGGVVDFLDDDARDLGDLGGGWEARLTIGTRTPLAIEAAYVGSAHNIDALGLDSGAVLVGTSVETDLRVNFTTMAVQPYVFGGIGYTRYDVTNADFNTSSVNDDEEMGHIPLGAGVGYQWGGFLFDLRGTVRPAFGDDLVDEPAVEDDPLDESDTATDLDTWSVSARLGWEF